MITKIVNDLFSFIGFLYAKKDYFISKQNLINEFNDLLEERNSLKPDSNYRAKMAYDKIQQEIAEKFIDVKKDVIAPIEDKIFELNIADISSPIINLNAKGELFELQRNFDEEDLERIFSVNAMYADFKKSTNGYHFYMPFFFLELDRDLQGFMKFFNTAEVENDEVEILQSVNKYSSLEFENIKKILAFFLVPGKKEESEEIFFTDILKHRINASREDERIYAIKFLIDDIKTLQEENRSFSNSSVYFQAKIDRFIEYCQKKILVLQRKIDEMELEQSALYERSIRVYRKASLEDAKRLHCNEGDIYSIIPEPKNQEEAIIRFKELHGQRTFELLRKKFLKTYGNTPTFKIINDELFPIYHFISEANQKSTEEAFKNRDHSDYLEYLRLENKFYQNETLPFSDYYNYFNSNSTSVYGKYFLYKDWLEELRVKLNKDEWTEYIKGLSKSEREDILQHAQELQRLAEISLNYSKGKKWSISNYPAELESISRVDLFIEHLSQTFETFINEGQKVDHIMDILMQTSKTNVDNPLLKESKSINKHLYNRLKSLKLILSKINTPSDSNQEAKKETDVTTEKIAELFEFMLTVDPRTHKKILSDSEYDKLLGWIRYYFNNNLQIPLIDNPIRIVNTAKGNVIYTFILIFRELRPTMTRPDSLFELIQACFYYCRATKVSSLRKQKEPQYYRSTNRNYSKNI
ncbi:MULTISPECIES: hypothetical protein [Chryseobacterium]|uniref:Uncharacterized protein n=1 Tax=Chryseobacterium aquaticum subsp. greenlandense TaxID=345663 RepID=A0A124F2Z5_9FLAO|nr:MULTISPECIES: hypothetical protein [Chryseobacterium]KNB61158.1 hypothetical protein AC804_11250 [Chryseobacterium sp. Hurlbut01]KUJ56351.1 hypothetical protein AR686_07250 [Chryseobacterium aquaticum subsp. greenlandense]